MVIGYVLISTKNSYEHEVADILTRLDKVVDIEPLLAEETALADPFFEEYNLIVKVKADDSTDLKNFVNEKIRTIESIEKIKLAVRPKL